ncbi:MAG: right-handed parallel beta-helix repeat-containing protein [Saprospiraceae bacterium]
MFLKALTTVLLLFFAAQSSFFAQCMQGHYTVGHSGADFPTIQSAIAEVEAKSWSDTVFFDIEPGVYVEQLLSKIWPNGPCFSTAPVIFRKNPALPGEVVVTWPVGPAAGTGGNYILRSEQSIYSVFEDIIFRRTGGSPNQTERRCVESESNMTFKNCRFEADPIDPASVSWGDSARVLISFAGYLTLDGCHFQGGMYGIWSPTWFPGIGVNLSARNCIFEGQALGGIWLQNFGGQVEIRKNRFDVGLVPSAQAIRIEQSNLEARIVQNHIQTTGRGVVVEYCAGPSSSSQVAVMHNFIIAPAGDAIHLHGEFYKTVCFNSIKAKDGVTLSDANPFYAINGKGGTVGGNIFDVETGPSLHLLSAQVAHEFIFQSNCYVPKTTQPVLVLTEDLDKNRDFNAWHVAGRERFSIQKTVNFVTPTDLHLAAPDDDLNGRAILFFLYLDEFLDIDGDTLPADGRYDIGADQIALPVSDASLSHTGSSTRAQRCGEEFRVEIRLTNVGEKPLTDARIAWKKNGIAQPDFEWTGNLPIGEQDTILLEILPFAPDSAYLFELNLTSANGRQDIYETANSIALRVLADLDGGDITVGFGGQFPTMADLGNRLKTSVFCHSARILLLPGIHAGALKMDERFALAPSKTLEITSFDGHKESAVWQPDHVFSTISPLEITNSGHIWVHDLKLEGAIATTALAVHNSSNVQVDNVDFVKPNWQVPLVLLQFSDLVSLNNCRIEGIWTGLFANQTRNLTVNNCVIESQGGPGFYPILKFDGVTDSRFVGNRMIGNAEVKNSKRLDFFKNEFSYLLPQGATANHGYVFENCDSLRVANNFFSGKNNWWNNLVIFSEVRSSLFFHNTLRAQESSGAALTVQLTTAQTPAERFQIANNLIISEHLNGLAMFVQNDPANIVSDRNAFFSGGQNLIAVSGGSSSQALADWQSFNGQDANSLVFQPPFVSEKNLRIVENPAEIAGKGVFLPGFSESDLDGDPRPPAAPDLGADQFFDLQTNVGLVYSNLPDPACHAIADVFVQLKNEGPDTLRHAEIGWTLNGETKPSLIWTGLLAAGETSDRLHLGEHFAWLPDGNSFEIHVAVSRDADTLDNVLANPNFTHRMGGTYYIGGSKPDFRNLETAADMLSKAGICGDLTFLLRPGEHFNPNLLPPPGATGAEKIRIEPDGPGLQIGEIRKPELWGLPNVEFRRLRLRDLGFEATSRNLIFEGCEILGSSYDFGVPDYGLVFNNCFFKDGNFLGRLDDSLHFRNCDFYPVGDGAVVLQGSKNWSFEGCRFGPLNYFQAQQCTEGFRIERNVFTGAPGLHLLESGGSSGNPAVVANNFFHFNNQPTIQPTFGEVGQVFFEESQHVNFQHNTLHFNVSNTLSQFTAIAAVHVIKNSKVNFENNIIKTRNGARAHHFTSPVFNELNFHHNFYDIGPAGLNNQQTDFSLWQLFGYEQNSTAGLVKFEDENDPTGASADLHIADDSPSIPLTTNVLNQFLTDIDGQLRNATQTAIGADEALDLPLAGAVWPGDCDKDNAVTTLDWLHLGVALGNNLSGPARVDQSISWIPKFADDWPDSVLTVNAKHADCNGDGLVSLNDTTAVIQNFKQEHVQLRLPDMPVGLQLFIDLPAGPYFQGQKIAAPLRLSDAPEALYGFAVELEFLENSIKPGSFWTDFKGNWLGTSAIGFYEKTTSGATALALTKTDGQNATGFGPVGVLHFEVGVQADSLKIQAIGTRGLLADGTEKPISPAETPTIAVLTGVDDFWENDDVQVFPNPSDGRIYLFSEKLSGEEIEVSATDALGRLVFLRPDALLGNDTLELDLSNVGTGVFWLKIRGESGVRVFKILIVKKS